MISKFFRENFELVHYSCFLTHLQKRFFKSLFFGYFLLVLKNSKFFSFLPHAQHAQPFCYHMLSMRSTFFTACSACIAHFLPHAQHAQHIFQRKLSMQKYFYSFRRLLWWLSMRKHIFLAQAQHAETIFQRTLSVRRPFFSAHSACVDLFLAHTQRAQTFFQRTLSVPRPFFSAHSACVRYVSREILM